jgi:hypothetical protein
MTTEFPCNNYSTYNEFEDLFKDIRAQNNYKYIKVRHTDPNKLTKTDLVEIGAFSKQEDGQGNNLNLVQKWNHADDLDTIIRNAHNISNRKKFYELKEIANGTISKQPNMLMRSVNFNKYKNASSFIKERANFTTASSMTIQADKMTEFFGYFHVPENGTYSFRINGDKYFFYYEDAALYDYSEATASLSKISSQHSGQNLINNLFFKAGDLIPIRIHINGVGTDFFSITKDNVGLKYNDVFVHLKKGGSYYNKYLMYFAFQPSKNKDDKYDAYFIDNDESNSYNSNVSSIEAMKSNLPLKYHKIEIDVPITFTSNSISKTSETEINANAPEGARIDTTGSKLFYADDLKNKVIIQKPYTSGNNIYHEQYNNSSGFYEKVDEKTGKRSIELQITLLKAPMTLDISGNGIIVNKAEGKYVKELQNGTHNFNILYNSDISIKYQVEDYDNKKCERVWKGWSKVWRGCWEYGVLREVKFSNIGGGDKYTKKINGHLNLTQTRTIIPIEQRKKKKVTSKISLKQKQKEKDIKDDVKSPFDSTGNIKMSNFNGVNPAPHYNRGETHPPKNKKLTTEYTYELDNPQGMENRSVYVDSSGQLVYGYTYDGKTTSSNITDFPTNLLCDDPDNCNYSVSISDNGTISVYNNSHQQVGNPINYLPDYIDSNQVLANDNWKILTKNSLSNNEKITPNGTLNEIVSSNGKYKLTFVGTKLYIMFCTQSYSSDDNIKFGVNPQYNNILHTISNPNEEYYLYRTHSNPFVGQTMFVRNNVSENIKTLSFLPQDYDKVFKPDYYTKTSNVASVNTNNYRSVNPEGESVDTCKTACDDDNNCEHFFHTDNICYLDQNKNPLPIYTNKDNLGYNISNMYKKIYKIKSDCDAPQTEVYGVDSTEYSDYVMVYDSLKTDYENKLPNDPALTFNCANEEMRHCKKLYKDNYNSLGKEGFQEGQTNLEEEETDLNQTNQENKLFYDHLINKLHDVSSNYFQTGEYIDSTFYDTSNAKNFNFNKYRNDKYSKDIKDWSMNQNEEYSKENALTQDYKTLLTHENSMYTIATISAATLIITAIILARE